MVHNSSRGSVPIGVLTRRVVPNLHGDFHQCVGLRTVLFQASPSDNSSKLAGVLLMSRGETNGADVLVLLSCGERVLQGDYGNVFMLQQEK